MIAVDTSAIVAILMGEADREAIVTALNDSDRTCISAGTLIELRVVCHRKQAAGLAKETDALLRTFDVETISVSEEQAQIAFAAYARFGKGAGHPAQLNFGDLFAYALAKSRDLKLLFKGDDFAHTDIVSAL